MSLAAGNVAWSRGVTCAVLCGRLKFDLQPSQSQVLLFLSSKGFFVEVSCTPLGTVGGVTLTLGRSQPSDCPVLLELLQRKQFREFERHLGALEELDAQAGVRWVRGGGVRGDCVWLPAVTRCMCTRSWLLWRASSCPSVRAGSQPCLPLVTMRPQSTGGQARRDPAQPSGSGHS